MSVHALRALQMLDTDQFAGTERHVALLSTELNRLGVRTTVACRRGSQLQNEAESGGVCTLGVYGVGGLWLPMRDLVRYVRGSGIDILHCHNGRTMLMAAALHRLTGVRVVATQHFLTPQHVHYRGAKRVAAQGAHRWVNRQVAHVIAVSEAARQEMMAREGIPSDRITTVPNGIGVLAAIDREERGRRRGELGVTTASPLIVTLARLTPEKGLTILLRAAPTVLAACPDARFIVVGEGPQRTELEALALTLGVTHAVRFIGFRSDATALLACAEMSVLPSLAEPAGLALLEAMALARPVVATRAGGPLEIVVDGETGLLVPPGDAAALASAILTLVSSPALCDRMGRSGQERYRSRYTAAGMARATLDIYRRMLKL